MDKLIEVMKKSPYFSQQQLNFIYKKYKGKELQLQILAYYDEIFNKDCDDIEGNRS